MNHLEIITLTCACGAVYPAYKRNKRECDDCRNRKRALEKKLARRWARPARFTSGWVTRGGMLRPRR